MWELHRWGFSGETEPIGYMWMNRKRFTVRGCGDRSIPQSAGSRLEAQGSQRYFRSRPEAQELGPGESTVSVLVWFRRPRNQNHPFPRAEGGGPNSSKLALPSPLRSIQTLRGLDDAHPPWWGPPLQIPVLISSGNNLTDTPRSHVSPAIWASLIPAKLTHKIDHPRNDMLWPSNSTPRL